MFRGSHQLDVFNKLPSVTEVATFGNCNANLAIRLYNSNSISSGYMMGISNNAFIINPINSNPMPAGIGVGIGTTIASSTLTVNGTGSFTSNVWIQGGTSLGYSQSSLQSPTRSLQVKGGATIDTIFIGNSYPALSNTTIVSCNISARTLNITSNINVAQGIIANSFTTTNGSASMYIGPNNAGYITTTVARAQDFSILDSAGNTKVRLNDVGQVVATGEISAPSFRTPGTITSKDITATGVIYANQISACNNYGIINLGLGDISAGTATFAENISVQGQITTGIINMNDNGSIIMPQGTLVTGKIICSADVTANTIKTDYLQYKYLVGSNLEAGGSGGIVGGNIYIPGCNIDVADGNIFASNVFTDNLTSGDINVTSSNIGNVYGSLNVYGSTFNVHTGAGGNWSSTAFTSNIWSSVTYVPAGTTSNITTDKFIAVASTGSRRILSSTDGITWSSALSPNESVAWQSVTWGSRGYVAVGNPGGVMTSIDGIQWVSRTSADANAKWASVTYSTSLSRYLAIAADSNTSVMVSSDGIIWTSVVIPFSLSGNACQVIWCDTLGCFFIIAVSLTSILVSTDGNVWTSNPLPLDDYLISIAWSSYVNKLICLTESGKILYSDNGIVFIDTNTTYNDANYITWFDQYQRFFVIGTNRIATSSDGITWVNMPWTREPCALLCATYATNLRIGVFLGQSTSSPLGSNVFAFNPYDLTSTPSVVVNYDGTMTTNVGLNTPALSSTSGTISIPSSSTLSTASITSPFVSINLNAKGLSNIANTTINQGGVLHTDKISSTTPSTAVNFIGCNVSNVDTFNANTMVSQSLSVGTISNVNSITSNIKVRKITAFDSNSNLDCSSINLSNINTVLTNTIQAPSAVLNMANNFLSNISNVQTVSLETNSISSLLTSQINFNENTLSNIASIVSFGLVSAPSLSSPTTVLNLSSNTLSNIGSILSDQVRSPLISTNTITTYDSGGTSISFDNKSLTNVNNINSSGLVSAPSLSSPTTVLNLSSNTLSNIESILSDQVVTSSISSINNTINLSGSTLTDAADINITGNIYKNGQLYITGGGGGGGGGSVTSSPLISTNTITTFDSGVSSISFDSKSLTNVRNITCDGVITASVFATTGSILATSIGTTNNGNLDIGTGNITCGSINLSSNIVCAGSLTFSNYARNNVRGMGMNVIFSCTKDTDALTVGDVFTFRVPDTWQVYEIRASLVSADVSNATTINVLAQGTSIFQGSSILTISAGTRTSVGSTPYVFVSTPTSILDDTEVVIRCVFTGSNAKGLKVTFYYSL